MRRNRRRSKEMKGKRKDCRGKKEEEEKKRRGGSSRRRRRRKNHGRKEGRPRRFQQF